MSPWKTVAHPRPLPPVSDRPTCRRCGEPLDPVTFACQGGTLAEAYARAATAARCPEEHLRVVRIERCEATDATTDGPDESGGVAVRTAIRHRVTYWVGRYGFRSDGRFCSQGCGYEWAVGQP